MLMVSSVAGARTTLASGFSYSLVRKRLQMLSRGASRRAGLRMLLVVPALAVLLALFSFTERPVAAGSPEQVPAELSDQLLSAFGYSADAVPAAVQAQTAAEEGPILFSRDDTVPSDDAEPTAAVQPGAAFADASGVSGYGAPVSRESPAVQRVSSKGDDVVIMVDGKVDPRGVQALNELDPSDVERITVGTKDSPVVMVTTKRYLHDYPEEAAAIRKREGDFGVREFLNASAEDPQASAGSRAGGSVPVKADGWDEAIEAAAAAIEQSALKLASSTLDLTANALVPLLPGALFHPGVESPPPATFRGQSRRLRGSKRILQKPKLTSNVPKPKLWPRPPGSASSWTTTPLVGPGPSPDNMPATAGRPPKATCRTIWSA